jgi:predicted DNA-binding protein with PD1-like motif
MMNDIAEDISVQQGHYGRLLVARIKPNQDLVNSLALLCKNNGFESAVVRGIVGSLIDGNLARGLDAEENIQHVIGPGVEILSVYGEVRMLASGSAEVALHGVLADPSGQIYAGRFVQGLNLSFITIEVSIQEWIKENENKL